MPNTDNLVMEMLLRSGLAQYPDKRLYNAAALLTPEERPNVNVSVVDPKDLFLFRSRPRTEAVFVPPGSTANPAPAILVNKNSAAYKDGNRARLAAVIAHEAEHSRRLKALSSQEGWEESPAYQRQHDVLKRLGEKDQNLLRLLLERSQKERVKETGGV